MLSAGRSGGRPREVRYRGRLIAVGTKHGKEAQFRPAFDNFLQARLITPAGIDTDQFGTFAGEVPRVGSAVGAARAKAVLATTITGVPLGLASEASYGPLPGSGWFGHEEILLFRDDELGIEVIEGYRTASVPGTATRIGDPGEVPPGLIALMPAQSLIVRSAAPAPGAAVFARKGIGDQPTLRSAITEAAGLSADGLAIVEPDLRAHHNPSRRQVLTRLARTLAHRLTTPCPECRIPGFGRVGSEPGLPCRICRSPTPLASCEIHACCLCEHTLSRPVPTPWADPADCPECNP